ncbi:MAG: hypothetical protein AAGK00_10215 [Pseudomonadota bacterium]
MITFEAMIETASFPTLIPVKSQPFQAPTQLPTGPNPSSGTDGTQKHLWGSWSNDLFNGGNHGEAPIATAYHGGGGRDTVDYSAYSVDQGDAINVNLKIGMSFSLTGRSQGDTFDSIENVIGTRWDDVIVGDDKLIGNTLVGGDGRDIIHGEGGVDLLVGGGNTDVLIGGTQDDTFRFYYYDSYSYLTPDVIKDFDQNGDDVLEFVFDKPKEAAWRAEAWVHEGVEGTMVFGTEELAAGPHDRFAVFLEGVNAEGVGAGDITFI